ncbi:hypothetical protein CDD81_3994 [Ophiocordyceps australis]|uniref:Amidohydrolase 3 domain-containing protein n=1 Tax=Ophiocordyceps australis TaxID=1399860 RepID=A0A2C5YBV2_9HYPO|nr:hypothetical protein CDD81_5198 [Ophiocordyceps australis]PHH64732.1 hypothetical protein CDD81_3994 [Ophiocordyceps australis]
MALFFTVVFSMVHNSLAQVQSTADFVFTNGSIYTMDSLSTRVEALAIKDGTISFVGSSADVKDWVGDGTKVVDLQNRMVMPGLIDSHIHVRQGGLALTQCDLNYQPLGLDEVVKHIQGCIDSDTAKTDDDWLPVANLDYQTLVEQSGIIGKMQLDQLKTRRPIFIISSDQHTGILNSRGLEVAKVTADTPDPPGGKIERLQGSNEPSGVLQDMATSLIPDPPVSEDEKVEALVAALKLLREAGITTFQEAFALEEDYPVYERIRSENKLSARGFFDLFVDVPKSVNDVDSIVGKASETISKMHDNSTMGPGPTLKCQAIKGFLDGVIAFPAMTASLIDPYLSPVENSTTEWAPDPKTMIAPTWSPEILTKMLEQLFLKGIDAQLHVDGDLAVRTALDAAETFTKKHPEHDFRLGLAHDELSHPDDWPRFNQLKVDAIVSFQWSQPGPAWIPNTFLSLSESRLNNLEAYSKIEAAGRPVIYGSDWPIDPMDYFLALKVGVTRTGDAKNPHSPASKGAPFDGVFPGEGISRESVLRAITINGARFLRADNHIGSLEPGKLADVVVLDKNFFEVPDEELGTLRVQLTMLGGEVVYVADEAKELGLEAKFPNNDQNAKKLDLRAVGGFNSRLLSAEGKAAIVRLRRQGECKSKHSG